MLITTREKTDEEQISEKLVISYFLDFLTELSY